jgi:ABC-type amino acid transport substrate-binding protein
VRAFLGRRWAIAAVAVVLVVALAALARFVLFPPIYPDLSLERVQKADQLVVGLDPSYPPFEVVNGQGQLDGLDVELSRELARRLGVKAQLVAIDYGSMFDALLVGKFDLVLGGVSPTPDYEKSLDYTHPYYDDGLVLVLQSDAPGNTIGIESGSDADLGLDQLKPKLTGFQTQPFDDQDQIQSSLQQRTLRGAIVDAVTGTQWAHQIKGVAVQPPLLTSTPYVIAARRGDQKLLKAVDAALASMLNDGYVAKLEAKWLQ